MGPLKDPCDTFFSRIKCNLVAALAEQKEILTPFKGRKVKETSNLSGMIRQTKYTN